MDNGLEKRVEESEIRETNTYQINAFASGGNFRVTALKNEQRGNL